MADVPGGSSLQIRKLLTIITVELLDGFVAERIAKVIG